MGTAEVKRNIRLTVIRRLAEQGQGYYVPAAVSGRHVHLSREDVEKLFGAGYALQPVRALSQPGQYACAEQVKLNGSRGSLVLRVLGPERKETQAEISITDAYKAGIEPVVRMSGDIMGTPGCALEGPAGTVALRQGVIVAARHLHVSAEQAGWLGLKDGEIVGVRKTGVRAVVLDNVVVRAGAGHSLELHLDTDEANAGGIGDGELLELVRR